MSQHEDRWRHLLGAKGTMGPRTNAESFSQAAIAEYLEDRDVDPQMMANH